MDWSSYYWNRPYYSSSYYWNRSLYGWYGNYGWSVGFYDPYFYGFYNSWYDPFYTPYWGYSNCYYDILFSPGSVSYDQYKDFEERGEEFNKLIKNKYNF
jgi:hypothetical protein